MPEAVTSRAASLASKPLLWPVLALVALLVINVIATPSFLGVRMQDGHLYGNLIDILRNGAPVLLIALGMTLVIATRGIDLSVGAIAAIAGAVACVYIAGAQDEGVGIDGDRRLHDGPGSLRPARSLERLPGLGAGDPADHRDAGADDRRPRSGDARHRRADHHRQQRHLRRPRRRVRGDASGGDPGGPGDVRTHRAGHPSYGAGHADRVRRDQPRGEPARRRPGPHDHLDRLRLLRPLRRHRRADDRGQHQCRGRQQRRAVDRARRDPGGRHRRYVAGRRPLLPDRDAGRRAADPDARHDDPQHRDPGPVQLPVQGGRRDRRLPRPVAEGARGVPSTTNRRRRPHDTRQARHERRNRHRPQHLGAGPHLLAAVAVPSGAGHLRPVRGHVRRRRCALRGLRLSAGLPQPVRRQRLPDRPRGRHDLRDPHRWHRPERRLGRGAVHRGGGSHPRGGLVAGPRHGRGAARRHRPWAC